MPNAVAIRIRQNTKNILSQSIGHDKNSARITVLETICRHVKAALDIS